MILHVYDCPAGVTYTDKKARLGKYIGEVTAEATSEPIENKDVVYANVGIFKVKVKILSTNHS